VAVARPRQGGSPRESRLGIIRPMLGLVVSSPCLDFHQVSVPTTSVSADGQRRRRKNDRTKEKPRCSPN
jgi:hypothetical protein